MLLKGNLFPDVCSGSKSEKEKLFMHDFVIFFKKKTRKIYSSSWGGGRVGLKDYLNGPQYEHPLAQESGHKYTQFK